MKRQALLLVATLVVFANAHPQSSGPQFTASPIIHGNRVMTSFGNAGVIGEPATLGSRAAWIYPTNGYIGNQSIFIGIELPVRDYNNDGIPDAVHTVITCPVDRTTARTGNLWPSGSPIPGASPGIRPA